VAWNKLLGERHSVQIRSAIEQVKEALHERSETADEMSAAFDVAPYGLLLVDDRLQIARANSTAAVLLRTEREHLVGSDVSQVIDDPCVVADIRAAAQNVGAKRVSIELKQDGSATAGVLRLTLCPVSHDDAHCALIAIEDVTQQRVAQAAMNSFLAKAAHELRTPLTNVRLFVEDALEHCERDLAATSKCLNVINEEAQRLERTVSEILSVSEIEAGSFGLKRDDVRLDSLLQQLKADHEAQARDKQIALDFELPPKLPVLQADRDKIALVLHNLVGNALKYTMEKGRVTVTATVEKGQFSIAVTDTGIGIDADEIERVFEKFYRSKDTQASQVKGSGLGLAISREVARLHGGDITVDSEYGKGSTFTFVLPVGQEEL
jgi:signal transduction histidine kinase